MLRDFFLNFKEYNPNKIMEKDQPFSKRHGLSRSVEKEITIREGAPAGLRDFIKMSYYEQGKEPSHLRAILTRLLRVSPDADNWSEFPNIDQENNQLLKDCEWFKIYDLIEIIVQKLPPSKKENFVNEVNEYFINNGIGWKVENDLVETRGSESFETAIKTVEAVLETAKMQTAKTEIKEALIDLSRRPTPDITGAIQHSLASLECVVREVTGNRSATLGELIRKYPNVVPKPLDVAIEKIWGYSSEQGRHLREGNPPQYLEAELVVEVSAALSTYLGKKFVGVQEPYDF
jgi:hypothetical protein